MNLYCEVMFCTSMHKSVRDFLCLASFSDLLCKICEQKYAIFRPILERIYVDGERCDGFPLY